MGPITQRDSTITIHVNARAGEVSRQMVRPCALCGTDAVVQETTLGEVLSQRDCKCGRTNARLHEYHEPAGVFGGAR